MKQLVKPRLLPLFGWGVLVAVGLFCSYVLYFRPVAYLGGAATPASPLAEKDSIEEALKNLADIKASRWLQMGISSTDLGQAMDIIAPAPEAAAVAEASATAEAMDPSLKGAVVVTSGKRPYLLLGLKRFRVGERIGTGETVRRINLQTVELVSPEGRSRTVEIGRGIGPMAEQAMW